MVLGMAAALKEGEFAEAEEIVGGSNPTRRGEDLMRESTWRKLDERSRRERERQIEATEFAEAMQGRKSWTTAHYQAVFEYLEKHSH